MFSSAANKTPVYCNFFPRKIELLHIWLGKVYASYEILAQFVCIWPICILSYSPIKNIQIYWNFLCCVGVLNIFYIWNNYHRVNIKQRWCVNGTWNKRLKWEKKKCAGFFLRGPKWHRNREKHSSELCKYRSSNKIKAKRTACNVIHVKRIGMQRKPYSIHTQQERTRGQMWSMCFHLQWII